MWVVYLILMAVCSVGAFCFGNKALEEWQKTHAIEGSKTLRPTLNQINKLGTRALWRNSYGGDRASYSLLLDWQKKIKDRDIQKILMAELKRIEGEYTMSIMVPHVQGLQCLCKMAAPNKPCSNGFEQPTGFLALNVIDHLSSTKRWDERIKSACFLRNIKTATDKNNIDKQLLYSRLVNIMKEDGSLGVSKMAFETYKELTGYSSNGVFDFDGAIKDWDQRKEDILKKDF